MSELFNQYELLLGRIPVPAHLYKDRSASLARGAIKEARKKRAIKPWRIGDRQKANFHAAITELLELGVCHAPSIYNLLVKNNRMPRCRQNKKLLAYKTFTSHVTMCNRAAGNKYFKKARRKNINVVSQ